MNITECFTSDILAQDRNVPQNDTLWTELLKNINMCGNRSEQELSEIGCLYYKPIYYAQYCGILELDDCE